MRCNSCGRRQGRQGLHTGQPLPVLMRMDLGSRRAADRPTQGMKMMRQRAFCQKQATRSP